MRKRGNMFLSDFVVDQFPIDKFKELIFITVEIVENFLLTFEKGFNYDSSSIASYKEKYGSSQRSTKSKIESIVIKNYDDEEVMSDFLNSYFTAYNILNYDEKKIFNATFIDNLSDSEIIEKYHTYSKFINKVRKSAIVRFCLCSGLINFVDIIE